MNYLLESYGGVADSLFVDKGFCCYTIYDKDRNMYYSGMKSYLGDAHPIGIKYFTSSSVIDFKRRFQKHPNQFDIKIEYFQSFKDMSVAEQLYHRKFNVGKNSKFYNAAIASGTNCGKGSLLCKNDVGSIYRISSIEYKTGQHKHVCNNKLLVYINGSDKLTSINKKDFDPLCMKTQFKDHVLCFDKIENKNRRIKKEIYESDPNRYCGITRGKRTVIKISTGEKVTLDHDDYSRLEYTANTASKTIKVYDMENKIYKSILRDEYINNKIQYKHRNSDFLNRIDLTIMKKRRVDRREYDNNPNNFADLNAQKYYIYNHKTFSSWTKLVNYLNISCHLNKNKIINNYGIKVVDICLQN